MNPTPRTFVFVATAVASSLVAAWAWYGSIPGDIEGFAEVGEPFFPKFDNPLQATSLTVVDFEKDSKEVQEFSVRQNDDKLWVIPSHYDYPAEANERLARTATSLIGVKKVAVQSRSKDDWKRFGVVEPDVTGAAMAEERGTRISLRDSSGNALVDLIVGNKVPERDGFYYVREPEKTTTYVAELEVDLSAKFSDWIEPDLLKVNQNDFVEIIVDKYSIDEQRGVIVPGETLQFAKEDLKSTGKWQLKDLQEDEQLDESPVRAIATNLDQLKIVGVRKKPEGLSDDFRVNPLVRQMLEAEMQRQGFFIAADREGNEKLYSNEGELIAGVGSGLQYTLYFGEIARGTGKDIETGLTANDANADADDEAGDETGDAADDTPTDSDDEESGPRRYLLIKAEFNEELLGQKPQPPVKPDRPAILDEPAEPEQKPAKVGQEQADGDKPDGSIEETAEPADDDDRANQDAADDDADDDAGDEADCNPFAQPQEDTAVDEADESADIAAEPVQESEPTDEPAGDEPAPADEPATQEPTTDEPATDEPATDEPATVEPATEEPATEEPATEEPATDEPATDEPATDEPDVQPAPPVDPKQAAQQAYDQAMAEYEVANNAYESDLKAYNKKVEDGRKKSEELARRFAGWYYVITADSFEKFRVSRTDVVSKTVADEDKDGEGSE